MPSGFFGLYKPIETQPVFYGWYLYYLVELFLTFFVMLETAALFTTVWCWILIDCLTKSCDIQPFYDKWKGGGRRKALLCSCREK